MAIEPHSPGFVQSEITRGSGLSLEELCELSSLARLVFDREEKIIKVSKAVNALLGKSEGELLNQSFLSFVSESCRNEFSRYVGEVFAGKVQELLESVILGESGEVPVKVYAYLTSGVSEQQVNCQCVLMPVSVYDLELAKHFCEDVIHCRRLECLFRIAQLVTKYGLKSDELYQRIIEEIAVSWQYSEVAEARLVINGRQFQSRNFKPVKESLRSDIIVHGGKAGMIEVCYCCAQTDEEARSFTGKEKMLLVLISSVIGRVEEHRIAEDKLRYSETRFRKILDNIQTGVALYQPINDGRDFIITDFNRAAEKIERIDRQYVIGKSVMDVFPSSKEFGIIKILRKVYKTGEPEYMPPRVYKYGGQSSWRENYLFPLPGGGVAAAYHNVSEKKKTQLALRMREQNFRAIADYTYFWEIWVSPQGKCLWTNPSCRRITGYTVAEILAIKDFPERLIAEKDKATVKKIFASALRGSMGREVEFRLERKDGHRSWVEISWQPIYDNKGVSQGFRATIRDIAQRKEAETRLRESQRQMATLMSNLPGMVYRCKYDKNRTMEFVSDGCVELTGYYPEELVRSATRNYGDLIREEDAEDMGREIENALVSKEPFEISYRIITAGNAEKWVTERGRGIYNVDGTVGCVEGFIADVSSSKQAEIFLSLLNRAVVSTLNGVIITRHKDSDNPIIYVNPSFERISGYSAEEVIGRDCRFLQGSEREQPALEIVRTAIRKKEDCRVILRNYRKNGSLFWSNLSISPVFDERHMVSHYVGIIEDITAKKRIEEAFRRSEGKYRGLYQTAMVGLYRSRISDGKVLTANKALAEMLGYDSVDQLVAEYVSSLHYEDGERRKELIRSLEEKGAVDRFEIVLIRRDGSKVDLAISARIYPEKGYLEGAVVDITKRKRFERERTKLLKKLRAANVEMESIINVASHDLRSPLVNIQGFGRELAKCCVEIEEAMKQTDIYFELDEKTRLLLEKNVPEALDYIQAGSDKMDLVLSGLLKLSRLGRAEIHTKEIDVQTLVLDLVKSMDYEISCSGAEVQVCELPRCKADPSQINRVFSNLLTNALKYLDPHRPGRIKISGKAEKTESTYCVEDNGVGMSPEYQEKIFEAFHRLEPDKSSGEGLGLTIAKRILYLNNGRIWAKSEPGKGSTFCFTLPRDTQKDENEIRRENPGS